MSNNIHINYRRFTRPLKRFVLFEKKDKKPTCVYEICSSHQVGNYSIILRCEMCGDYVCYSHRKRPAFKNETYILCNDCFEV